MPLLVLLSCLAMVVGWFASEATIRLAFICSSGVFAILARLWQSSDQHDEVVRLLRGNTGDVGERPGGSRVLTALIVVVGIAVVFAIAFALRR